MIPDDLPGLAELGSDSGVLCRGGSAIISPMGDVLAGPLYDTEGILTAELDLTSIIRSKLDFDVTGQLIVTPLTSLLLPSISNPFTTVSIEE